jgi:hypothetical protein
MATNNNDQNQQQMTIELGEKEAEGIYSNLAIISHSPAEFVIDFTRILPGVPKARVHARIVMTPQHAKLLPIDGHRRPTALAGTSAEHRGRRALGQKYCA